MSNPLALIVDDEPDIRELLEITLGRMQIDTRAAEDLRSAREWLQKESFDLCLTDMRLPDGNGIELVETISKHYPSLPVAVITAHGNMDSAVQALKAGAFDFVSKPVDLTMLRKLVGTALKLEQATASKETTPDNKEKNGELLGKSAAAEQIRTMIRKLARSQAPVFISGESGTGKELAARLIHEQGPRADHNFIAVNCGAIPQELMESEFFGHLKGSFTGATADKEGLFQAADGGTLFLDEVADLPLNMQVKLLRAIQEKSIRPVGAQKELPVDVRIASATHKDLSQLVEQGEFRQDLFYRINVIELAIPPLRERREDIALLADKMLTRIAEHSGVEKPRIDRDALKALFSYGFPGNIRELENMLERAVALCEGSNICLDDLLIPQSIATLDNQDTAPELEKGTTLDDHMEKVERELITKALEQTHWNKTAAAKKLGISFRALRYKLDKLGIE
ncbi:MAG: sigma-54 dependent transcriptional regulator [Sedimenticola sp.]|nr:sigma-54 dependent transcriptional regulator [Sedimenticola sp.]